MFGSLSSPKRRSRPILYNSAGVETTLYSTAQPARFLFRVDLFFFYLVSALGHKMYSLYSVAAAVCSCVFPTLAALAVAARFRARAVQNMKPSWDDWLILSALVCLLEL